MEFLLEAIGYFLTEIIIGTFLLYPGACVLWLLNRGNKSLKHIKDKERIKCFTVSLLLLFLGLLVY